MSLKSVLLVTAAASLAATALLYKLRRKKKPTVVFVVGGPGAGKGTQCALLTKKYNFVHLSAGDLLREEQSRPNSLYASLIKSFIRDGQVVPGEITIALLKQAIEAGCAAGAQRFLVDGFPRALDQGLAFEEQITPASLVLFLQCDENVMLERLMKRSESSGRIDDNSESIKKRFQTFWTTSFPVVEYFEKTGKLRVVDCKKSVDEVAAETCHIFDEFFGNK